MTKLAWIGDDKEPWRGLIKDTPVHVVDEDSGEIIEISPEQGDPNDIEGLLISFCYTDNVGQETIRTILCYHCWEANHVTYVQGYCTMRQAFRTFRVDRMSKVLEIRSSRTIDDAESYFDHFADALPRRWTAGIVPTPEPPKMPRAEEFIADRAKHTEQKALRWHRRHQARRACIDGLRVLSYIAMSDGVRNDQERNIQDSYIESRLAMIGFDRDREILVAMIELGLGLAVPFRSLVTAINKLPPDPPHYALVCECAAEMIEADGGPDRIQSEAYHRLMAAGGPMASGV